MSCSKKNGSVQIQHFFLLEITTKLYSFIKPNGIFTFKYRDTQIGSHQNVISIKILPLRYGAKAPLLFNIDSNSDRNTSDNNSFEIARQLEISQTNK